MVSTGIMGTTGGGAEIRYRNKGKQAKSAEINRVFSYRSIAVEF
jgi:hypothetical protein